MARKFNKTLSDIFNNPITATISPAAPVVFDLLGGNKAAREDLMKEASTPLPQEAALIQMLKEQVQTSPNAQVQATNDRILDAAKRARLDSQRSASQNLLNQLGDAGLIDSGIAQRGFQDIAAQGGESIQNLATQLAGQSEDLRRRFEQERIQAQTSLAGIDRNLKDRQLAVEQQLEAERMQLYQNFAQMISLALSFAGGTPTVSPGNLSSEQALQMLLQQQGQPQGQTAGDPGLTPAPLFGE